MSLFARIFIDAITFARLFMLADRYFFAFSDNMMTTFWILISNYILKSN